MRRFTVINSSFGNMPIAGYITEILKVVSNFDGWYALDFANEFRPYAERLDEDGEGEVFIALHSDAMDDMYGDLVYEFFRSESELNNTVDEVGSAIFKPNVCRIFRLFGHDEEFGLEELKLLF